MSYCLILRNRRDIFNSRYRYSTLLTISRTARCFHRYWIARSANTVLILNMMTGLFRRSSPAPPAVSAEGTGNFPHCSFVPAAGLRSKCRWIWFSMRISAALNAMPHSIPVRICWMMIMVRPLTASGIVPHRNGYCRMGISLTSTGSFPF